MIYEDLPEELRSRLEDEKVALGLWPAGVEAPKQFVNTILANKGSDLVGLLEDKGYVQTDVGNWYGQTAAPFIGDNDECIRLVENALLG